MSHRDVTNSPRLRTHPHRILVDGQVAVESLNSWSIYALPRVLADVALALERNHDHDDARHILVELWIEEE